MKVRILQHLCPQRHCIMAMPYQTDDGQEIPAHVGLLRLLEEELHINPWCGICHSRQLFFEDRATIFKTLDEARGPMAEMEARNMATRKYLDASKG